MEFLASDAFFPFRDSIDTIKDSGIGTVIQPGARYETKRSLTHVMNMGLQWSLQARDALSIEFFTGKPRP